MSNFYYLHQNGELIHKIDYPGIEADFRESDLVIAFWPLNTADRSTAWGLLVEALAAGASESRIDELAEKWNCDNEDAIKYVDYLGIELKMDGDQYCATRRDFVNLQDSPAGFGETALQAFSDLAKILGYRPAKMWGNTFQQLVTA